MLVLIKCVTLDNLLKSSVLQFPYWQKTANHRPLYIDAKMTVQIHGPCRMSLVNATSYAVLTLNLEGSLVFPWVEKWDKLARMRFTGKIAPFFVCL